MSKNNKNRLPIVVDLDGTLLLSDILVESFLILIKQNPIYIILAFIWLFKGGKAQLKWEIARRVDIDVSTLPYNLALIDYLKTKKAEGHVIALATASNIAYANDVAQHLGLFDEVFASDQHTNLSGSKKREALNQAFGKNQYLYAGNAPIDLKVWSDAAGGIVVGSLALAERARSVTAIETVIEGNQNSPKHWLKALRVHQWVKNGLVFIPLFSSHQLSNVGAVFDSVVAFVAFSLCASSVYLLNDLLDLKDDRQHATKCKRPFAAGTLNLVHGLVAAPVLLLAAFILALLLPWQFFAVLLGYYTLTFAYSFYLKRIVLVDVITLASLYTVRIIAGTAAIGVALSFWLLAFSIFVFLSLAIVKRYTELLGLKKKSAQKTLGRGYQVDDIELLSSLGGASGYISVLVLALYINSAEVKVLYSEPAMMWPICLVMLYWISRVWIIAHRGEMNDDPIVFALKDKVSIFSGVIIAGFLLAATF